MAKITMHNDGNNNNSNIPSYQQTIDDVHNSAISLDEIVDELTISCCKDLDDYIMYVKGLVDDVDTPISDAELDDIILTIPTLLYFTGNAQETLGIREDISKMDETNKYNNIFINTEGTVQAKQAYAKLQVQNETIATMVYQRACKKIKLRCDYALEILQSAKKILSRRLAELELSKSALNKNQNN